MGKPGTEKVAVTGGAASGKSSVCRYLESNGVTVISLDAVSRELMMPGGDVYKSIVRHFGESYVADDSSLDRQALRNLITLDPEARKSLEAMVQPEILRVMFERMAACEERREALVVVEVPLLFESGLDREFDLNVLVTVSRKTQIQRIMDRDSVTEDEAVDLIGIQMPQEEKMKRADIIIENNRSYEDLCREVDRIFKKRFENKNLSSKPLDS